MSEAPRERRRFNTRERTALYLAADGKCQECGVDLEPGWHADHRKAYSRGGATDVTNGQAYCPPCNLKKGSTTVQMTDAFQARPFQRDVINSVLDGIAAGRRFSVVLASPGSGKTLAYQGAATYAHRAGLIDYVAVFVPRSILAQQCETTWLHQCARGHCPDAVFDPTTGFGGYHNLFDARGRIGSIRHVINQNPPLPPNVPGIGFVATYSALVKNPAVFEAWAKRHRGRFLLVADEAQFCGSAADERSGGTKAGSHIEQLHEYAAHTLLLTGTPYRSDKQPLILADYDPPDEEGKRRLLSHAEATYATGIAEQYLRRFEATLQDARVRRRYVSNTVMEFDLSNDGSDLVPVLRKPEVWQAIVDAVVDAVKEKKKVNPRYRGLISCMEQNEARLVLKHLANKHPGMRTKIAISDDGADAEAALREFKVQDVDILVTVRKAFIGYDCPEITVVGVLTHYRDPGHLMQLVGRGLRMWSGEPAKNQSCRIVTPDDPLMMRFIDHMRGELEQGLRERERREADKRKLGEQDDDVPELAYVEAAYATTARAVSNDTEVDSDQRLLIQAIKADLGMSEDVTMLAQFADALGLRLNAIGQTNPPAAPAPVGMSVPLVPLTEQEQVDRINVQTADIIKSFVARTVGINPKDPQYQKAMGQVTSDVNAAAGYRAKDCRTAEQAQRRLTAAMRLQQQVGLDL